MTAADLVWAALTCNAAAALLLIAAAALHRHGR